MENTSLQTSESLRLQGYFFTQLRLPAEFAQRVAERDWPRLDREIAPMTLRGGMIFEELRKHSEFSAIEFIISIRSSLEEPDEDGIWHDDGSRVLAFSLSLTDNPSGLEGGCLEVRKRFVEEAPLARIATPPFGTMIVFATGQGGYEHRICKVLRGERIIIAGWCT